MKNDRALYDRLFAELIPILCNGRPGDAAHIKSAYKNAQRFIRKGVHNPRILYPAVLLHDVGFGFLRKSTIPLVAGQKKISELSHAVTALSSAYAGWILARHGFSDTEIKTIRFCIEYGDDEKLSVKNPPAEMILLHDLNFLDRFYPHRVRIALKRHPKKDFQKILDRSLAAILTPEIKEEAKRRYETLDI